MALEHEAALRPVSCAARSLDTGLEKSISTSPTRITPASGTSSALSVRSSVVLPEPDGPMIAVAVPRCTVNETPLSTLLSPKAFSHILGDDAVLRSRSSVGHRATYLSSRCSRRPWPNDSTRQITQ